MFMLKLVSRIVPAILASLTIAAATGAQANEGQKGGAACENASTAARFEFERQRTEGNVSPFFQANASTECASRMADNKADGDVKTAADASNQAPVVLR